MEIVNFDALTRRFSRLLTRRRLAGALGLAAVGLPGLADAKKKHRKLRRKRKKHEQRVAFNEFGCVNLGHFCQNDEQCCSGICEGRKGKKRCRAHGESTCQAGQQLMFCGVDSVDVPCVTSTGEPGFCDTTTGQAPYCTRKGACMPCRKDADCIELCGQQAACVVCSGCVEANGAQTSCVGPSDAETRC